MQTLPLPGRSISIKLLIIGFLMLVLLIPAAMINSTIRQRQSTRYEAIQSITSSWGGAQTISGPWLRVPYEVTLRNGRGDLYTETQYAYFLPDTLEVEGALQTQKRSRGIFDAVLYSSAIKMKGRFPVPDFKALNIPPESILWNETTLGIGIPDMKGVRDTLTLQWNNRPFILNPGLDARSPAESGASVRIPLSPNDPPASYSLDVQLNGSQQIRFLPMGKVTTVHLTSSWPTPGFNGGFLPSERAVGKDGFDARWKVLHLNRNYPQQWLGERSDVQDSGFGVELILSADQYQKTSRSTKYAVMFILLTFGLIFFIELRQKRSIHLLQYLLVGLAIVLFYSLLLSLSEHVGFPAAYAISAVAIASMIGLYSRSLFESARTAWGVTGLVGVLYAYLYVLLQIEDYALLVGNLGLFISLALAMWASKRINLGKED